MSLQPNILPRLGRLATAILVVLTLAPLGALGQERALERRVPASPNEVRLSYAPIVQRAAPAVVNVYAAKTVAVSAIGCSTTRSSVASSGYRTALGDRASRSSAPWAPASSSTPQALW